MKKKKKNRKRERKTKKSHFDRTPARLFTSKLSKTSQVTKDSFQLIFHFWFVRRPQNCAIVRHGPRDKVKKECGNFGSVIGFFGDGQQKSQYFWFCRQKLVVCSKVSFSKNSYHMETSQVICFATRTTGFYIIQVFTERHFRTDINSKFLVILLSESYLWQWLNMPSKVGQLRAAWNG